ncbi:hypothetical protein [Flagellimonas sp.]|uniref:hypothetical protein n=1 Tax=Flagellimonas sp. TaxID=2058762 RepID=UPI003B510D7B
MSKKQKYPLKKLDEGILKYVPKFFEILGWVTILGVLRFISFEKKLISAIVFYAIGFLLLALYMQVYVFYEILGKKYTPKKGLLLVLGMLFALSMFWLLESIMPHIT